MAIILMRALYRSRPRILQGRVLPARPTAVQGWPPAHRIDPSAGQLAQQGHADRLEHRRDRKRRGRVTEAERLAGSSVLAAKPFIIRNPDLVTHHGEPP